MNRQHQESFDSLSATFTADQREKWTREVQQWEAEPEKHDNPYDDVVVGE